MPHLAHDSGVDDGETTLGHHLHQIAIIESEAQIPSDALDDNLTVEVTPNKHFANPRNPATAPLQIIGPPDGQGAQRLHQSPARRV